MREVNERRQRNQSAGAMHTDAVVHALLEIASILAHRRCLIDYPVRSHARSHGCGGSIRAICRWTVCETVTRDGVVGGFIRTYSTSCAQNGAARATAPRL